jgi:hypothetical protein
MQIHIYACIYSGVYLCAHMWVHINRMIRAYEYINRMIFIYHSISLKKLEVSCGSKELQIH